MTDKKYYCDHVYAFAFLKDVPAGDHSEAFSGLFECFEVVYDGPDHQSPFGSSGYASRIGSDKIEVQIDLYPKDVAEAYDLISKLTDAAANFPYLDYIEEPRFCLQPIDDYALAAITEDGYFLHIEADGPGVHESDVAFSF